MKFWLRYLCLAICCFPPILSAQKYYAVRLGAGMYRPWTVAPDGLAEIPPLVSWQCELIPQWWLQLGVGYERDVFLETTAWNSPFPAPRVWTEEDTIRTLDQVWTFVPGLRYQVPGPYPRVRMMLGGDFLLARFPERIRWKNSNSLETDQMGNVLSSITTRSTIQGYEGWGLGLQLCAGGEVQVANGLWLGMEAGPGIFQRFREVAQVEVRESRDIRAANPGVVTIRQIELAIEEGLPNEISKRLQGTAYLAWRW